MVFDLTVETYQGSIERYYFWVHDQLEWDMNYNIHKLRDDFDSSVTSSFWGSIEQRKTTQQEKVSQFLGLIGQMTKSMFQIIRTLRIMDQRYKLYTSAKKGDRSSEIALKGLWVDMVEGGGKNPASVYSLATKVGFATLPDLFFDITPKSSKKVDSAVEVLKKQGINRKVREVLKRKLKQFMIWRESTDKEIRDSRRFYLKYLRQHFNTIRLYMSWIKPYLKNLRKLKQKGKGKGNNLSSDILNMADNAENVIDLVAVKDKFVYTAAEVISRKDFPHAPSFGSKFKKYFPVVKVTFKYRTAPQMAFQQQYQRGAIHIGKTNILIEGKAMTRYEIEKELRAEEEEDLELLKDLDASIAAFGDELVKYLKEADESDAEKKVGVKDSKNKKDAFQDFFGNVLKPFSDLSKSFGFILKPFSSFSKERGSKGIDKKFEKNEEMIKLWKFHNKKDSYEEKNEEKIANKLAGSEAFAVYDNFKKSHGMVRW